MLAGWNISIGSHGRSDKLSHLLVFASSYEAVQGLPIFALRQYLIWWCDVQCF